MFYSNSLFDLYANFATPRCLKTNEENLVSFVPLHPPHDSNSIATSHFPDALLAFCDQWIPYQLWKATGKRTSKAKKGQGKNKNKLPTGQMNLPHCIIPRLDMFNVCTYVRDTSSPLRFYSYRISSPEHHQHIIIRFQLDWSETGRVGARKSSFTIVQLEWTYGPGIAQPKLHAAGRSKSITFSFPVFCPIPGMSCYTDQPTNQPSDDVMNASSA